MENKLIYVHGDDYASLFFEDWVRNNKLTFEDVCELDTIEDDEGYAEIEVKHFGEICPQFLSFIRSEVQDYDESKHHNFYFSDDKIFDHE